MQVKTYYRIRHRNGLYSTGGCRPHFSEKGKTWPSLQAISSHLAQHRNDFYGQWYQQPVRWDDLEIVEYRVVENEFDSFPMKKYHDELVARRNDKEAKSRAAAAKARLERARKEYEELTQEVKRLEREVSE